MKRSYSEAELAPLDHSSNISTLLEGSWMDIYHETFGFTSDVKDTLLKSPHVDAKGVLRFTLEYVFSWCSCYGFILRRPDNFACKATLLKFVTEWLAIEPEPGHSSIPSLFRLSVQRIAMELFPKFLADIEKGFKSKKLSYFTTQLQNDLGSALEKQGVPEFLKEKIIEEIYIFIIVYILYVDIRTLSEEPESTKDLSIPILNDFNHNDPFYCWRMDLYEILEVVKNEGRGSLAKAGILSYSANVQIKTYGTDWPMFIIREMIGDEQGSLVTQHPFACSIAFVPIISTAYAMFAHPDNYFRKKAMEEILLDWMIKPEEIKHKDMELLYPTMLKFSLRSTDDLPNIHPFMIVRNDMYCKLVQDCVDVLDVYQEYGFPPEFNSLPSIKDSERIVIPNIRFNGNFSKFELLRNVMSLGGIETMKLDLEDCAHLDVECLEAMLRWIRPRSLYLNGTPFNEKRESGIEGY